eukprot:TRINITY_DN7985_c0_g1_i1.p1 TRINITY_DN7985_c0_g1~~TRINITY_DN7985_c0_g1_i1.p1  ORF type:complete len:120 (-),score=33.43 TRINITY_DN7985_c0_g1_i1:51-362(-)
MSNQQLLNDRSRMMKEQDADLDVLLGTVTRQKEIAGAIGVEAEEQIGLLNRIEQKTDRENTRLRNTNRRVDKLRAKSSTKALWVTICFLIIALVVVAFLAVYL